jgi:hypothetical protein
MHRYRWGLIKTLEFLNGKKPGLEMTASLLKKLLQYEQSLEKDNVGFLSKDWDNLYEDGEHFEEELVIVNSYRNTQLKQDIKAIEAINFKMPNLNK